ncbi:MAG: hypothetical protein U0R24_06960 [Solirubrobacterales bacterium]
MKFKQMAALAACAAIVAGAVGCGGDDDGGDTTATETLTKEEWIKQADAICSAGDGDVQQAAEDAGLSNKSTPRSSRPSTPTR